MALLCGLAVPLDRLSIVLRHALAFLVHNAEIVLGVGKALLCGLAVPETLSTRIMFVSVVA